MSFTRYWDFIRRRTLSITLVFTTMVLLLTLASLLVYNTYQNDLPSFEQLHNIEPSLITRVYANDSTLIKKFFKEHRILISYNDIPP
ncbi:MAG: hypothetical protein GY855_04340, partial [candidate division Zixibacteria bacterium]|nr:hypothetical protein [candidate division Zixibacteria bacterium]